MNDKSRSNQTNKKIDRITGLPFNFIGHGSVSVQTEWVTKLMVRKIQRNVSTTIIGTLSEDTEREIRKEIGVGGYRTNNGEIRLQGDAIYKLKPLLIKMKLADNSLLISRLC
jgi:translation initiation factor 1 (eIF-1/SUI1)